MITGLSDPATARNARPANRIRHLVLGRPEEPRWARPALWAILALAAVLYAWGLSKNGYANSYYAAAVKSGTESWKAFFFGSLDAASYITVDKPPMALWVMELFGRIFGFSTWTLLLPQVIEGVAAVALLSSGVRRAFGPAAALIAALVLTLTPITVAINRDDNPDTLLTLFLVLAAWACLRAVESGRLRWLLASGFILGCAFNTKMLQAYIALPALAITYLLSAPGRAGPGTAGDGSEASRSWLRRVGHLLAAGAVLAVSSFWWMIVVDLIPAGSRPFVGSSTKNTVLDLVIGYNGIGRITGGGRGHTHGGAHLPGAGQGAGAQGLGGQRFAGHGSGAHGFGGHGLGGHGLGGHGFGGHGFGGMAGASGPGRLFGSVLGGQISWLLPFAVLALVAGVILYWRRPRTDPTRATLVLWGVWLAVHFVVFSFSNGGMHPYYTTAMAPAIAALTGIGAVTLFGAYRRSRAWTGVLPLGIAITGAWAFALLRRTPTWNPPLAWIIAGLTVVAVIGLPAARLGGGALARLAIPTAVVGLLAGLAGPAAYAASAAGSTTNGNNPLAGPSTPRSGMGAPWMHGGGMPMQGGRFHSGNGQAAGGQGGRFPGGHGGGGWDMGQVSPHLVSYLQKNQAGATWLVAVNNARGAAPIILQTGKPAMAMGGFSGSDPAMTAQKLQRYVQDGKLHYILLGGDRPGWGGGDSGDAAVTSWITKNCATVKPSEYGGSSSTQNGQVLYRCG
jgi:4-amino-4-deoxy-L-arabinose transferase-like glycosyltransferase